MSDILTGWDVVELIREYSGQTAPDGVFSPPPYVGRTAHDDAILRRIWAECSPGPSRVWRTDLFLTACTVRKVIPVFRLDLPPQLSS